MSKNMGVYKITNKINGMFYIGSSKDLAARKRQHFADLRSNRHVNPRLQNAYNKYGKSSFVFQVIKYVEIEAELRNLEQHYLDTLDACNRDIGYNLNAYATGGGLFGEQNGFYGKTHSEKTLKILRKKCALKGERNPFFGKGHLLRGKKNPNYGNKGAKNPLSKQIAQIDPEDLGVIKVWGASIDITRELGYHGGNICRICKDIEEGKPWKKYKNYNWCYEKDLAKLKTKVDYSNPQRRAVLQLDKNTGELIAKYNSLAEAAESMGVRPENISRCCRGINKTSQGYTWMFADEEVYKPNKTSLRGKNNPRARSVIQLTPEGKYVAKYSTIKEAAELTNTSLNGLYQNLSGRKNGLSGGYKWMYLEEYEALTN